MIQRCLPESHHAAGLLPFLTWPFFPYEAQLAVSAGILPWDWRHLKPIDDDEAALTQYVTVITSGGDFPHGA